MQCHVFYGADAEIILKDARPKGQKGNGFNKRKQRRQRNKKTRRNRKRSYDGKRFDLYVVRLREDGTLANSKPCQNCVSAMRCAGIRRVFYSTGDGHICMEYPDTMESYHTSAYQRHVQMKGYEVHRWKW